MIAIVAIDIGTTHCKAGLYQENGTVIRIASRSTVSHKTADGCNYYDPREVQSIVTDILTEVTQDFDGSIAAVGIASMAETGLLVDRTDGMPRSAFVPWFETASQPIADLILENTDPVESYLKYGLKINFKSSLAKILWLKRAQKVDLDNTVWLSAADYVAYWLSGVFATDYSLACRTLAFDVYHKVWDEDWLRNWNLPTDLFPPVHPSGQPVGQMKLSAFGIPKGTPVSVCGHDHVCAALAMGAIKPGVVFDSMGTAETLIGALAQRPLTREDYDNGLHYGLHVADGLGYWMGGISASGGSIEWLRNLIPPPAPSYADLENLLNGATPQPTGILYFPYLLGSGSPHTDSKVRAALIGLSASHGAEDILKAILEGNSYEVEFIRRAGERMSGKLIPILIAAGGGTRYRAWSQIKANITGCRMDVSIEPEGTLLGAALAAAIGVGVYSDAQQMHQILPPRQDESFFPNPDVQPRYQDLYERGWLPFQQCLRHYRA